MKKVLVPFILTAIALTVFFLLPHQSEAKTAKTSFTASITCDGCKNKIEKKMKDVDGVNTTMSLHRDALKELYGFGESRYGRVHEYISDRLVKDKKEAKEKTIKLLNLIF